MGFGGHRRSAALAAVLTMALLAARALASETAQVLIVEVAHADDLLDEAIVRARGELAAVGLTIRVERVASSTVPSLEENLFGMLVLDHSGRRVRIRAYAPGAALPVEQSMDLRRPHGDAEVIAVRAVEALRAAMLESARHAQDAHRAIPPAVSGFTRLGAPPLGDRPREPEHPADSLDSTRLRFWAGPELAYQPRAAAVSAGVQAGAWLAHGWSLYGIVAESGFSALRLSEPAGLVEVKRRSLEAHFGARFEPVPPVELFGTLGIGVAEHAIVGQAVPTFIGRSEDHVGLCVSARAGSVFWLWPAFGSYLSLAASVAPNAPAVRVAEREVAVLDRPMIALSVGIAGQL